MKWIIYNRYPIIILSSLILITATAFSLVIFFNPERVILGKWKETGWSYENIDKNDFVYHDIKLARKHESESWRFADNNILYFHNGDVISAQALWKIKGRGHILQLTYEDGDTELYDIKELNDHELIINFDIGMESRGIARLVFTKISNK